MIADNKMASTGKLIMVVHQDELSCHSFTHLDGYFINEDPDHATDSVLHPKEISFIGPGLEGTSVNVRSSDESDDSDDQDGIADDNTPQLGNPSLNFNNVAVSSSITNFAR